MHGLTMDRTRRAVRSDDVELVLTPTEFRLLWTLARNPGRTFSRLELMDLSHGKDANALDRTVDVHIRALRKKLHDNADLIETVRGIGYRFRA
jgi:two-component system phosphate regulon response regulator PhoB